MNKIIVGSIVIIIIVVGSYFYSKNNLHLTPDQIFKEASSQLGFKKEDLTFLTIYGQDRITYSLGHSAGSGVTFAYKINGKWYISGGSSQGVPLCSELESVPEKYRQTCIGNGENDLKYSVSTSNGGSDNINYPKSEAVQYIKY